MKGLNTFSNLYEMKRRYWLIKWHAEIEEPFSIMPLEDIVKTIDEKVSLMNKYDATDSTDHVLGADISPLW